MRNVQDKHLLDISAGSDLYRPPVWRQCLLFTTWCDPLYLVLKATVLEVMSRYGLIWNTFNYFEETFRFTVDFVAAVPLPVRAYDTALPAFAPDSSATWHSTARVHTRQFCHMTQHSLRSHPTVLPHDTAQPAFTPDISATWHSTAYVHTRHLSELLYHILGP